MLGVFSSYWVRFLMALVQWCCVLLLFCIVLPGRLFRLELFNLFGSKSKERVGRECKGSAREQKELGEQSGKHIPELLRRSKRVTAEGSINKLDQDCFPRSLHLTE